MGAETEGETNPENPADLKSPYAFIGLAIPIPDMEYRLLVLRPESNTHEKHMQVSSYDQSDVPDPHCKCIARSRPRRRYHIMQTTERHTSSRKATKSHKRTTNSDIEVEGIRKKQSLG